MWIVYCEICTISFGGNSVMALGASEAWGVDSLAMGDIDAL